MEIYKISSCPVSKTNVFDTSFYLSLNFSVQVAIMGLVQATLPGTARGPALKTLAHWREICISNLNPKCLSGLLYRALMVINTHLGY
jgi:hypothetical protein